MAVQLTGYQGPRGFKAEQVYDKSGQMQQQARQDAQYRQVFSVLAQTSKRIKKMTCGHCLLLVTP
jgi:YD repeat-containing protein